MRARTLRIALTVLALATLPSVAAGDEWLTFRHDARRTGASSGSAAIDRPTVHWRRYLGGQLAGTQFFADDVDGDGANEVVYVAGGRAIAKRPDNLILWESPLLALTYLVGTTDFDADGAREVLAVGQAGYVFLLAGADGSVLWENPRGPIGTVGAVRVGDLDGDGADDLYIAECRCCTIRGSSNGVAYSFAAGLGAAAELWTTGPGIGGCSANDQLADVDGDGLLEIVIANQVASMQIVDARTGLVRWDVPAPASGSFYPASTIYPAALDADPGDELVVVSDGYQAVSGTGARRVAVWDHAGGAIDLLWEANAPDRVNDGVYSAIDAMGDLDGDGTTEVAFTITSGGASSVELRDGVSGATRATIPSAALQGAVDLDDDGRPELLVAEGGALSSYRLVAGAAERRWSLPDRALVRYLDHDRWPADANATVPLALDLDDDAALELIVAGTDASGRSALFAIDAAGTTAAELGSFAAPEGVSILVSARAPSLTRARDQVMTVTSDGYLIVLDEVMEPTNRVLGEIPLPGMRVGGYYSGASGLGQTPFVASLGEPAIVVRDSRPALVRMDARSATAGSPPSITWERFGASWPLIADLNADGTRDVAMMEGADVVALDAATARAEIWRSSGALAQGPYSDLLPAARGGGTDVMLARAQAGSVMEGISLDGATGAPRWAPFSRALNWGYITPAVGDLTGDGVDDLVTVTNSTLVLDGASGGVVNDNGTFVAYALPMLFDANGDGSTDAWVHGGYFADRLLSSSMSTLAVRSDHTSPHTGSWGALVSCGGEPAVVAGSFESPELWTVRPRDAAPLSHRALIDGEVFDPASVPSDRRGGFLGNVTSVASLSTTHGPAVLVGSTDGYLYALEPCTLAPIWSLELRYPVGEPVIADANGDGADDLLVSCADGFLYGVGDAALEAPASVRDVDPASATPDADVDTIDTVSTLWAAWDAVPGATSYQVGVFTASGSEARFPNYQDVGNVTSAELIDLPLRQGRRYYVSVIPIGPDGPGLEASSDGVAIGDELGPTATVSVAPSPAWPAGGVPPVITARCDDRVALGHMRVDVATSTGTSVRVITDGDASGTSFSSNEPWDGSLDAGGSAEAGYYVALVTCTDARGRTASAEAEIVLDPSASDMPDGGVVMRDGGAEPPPATGCGCRANGRGGAPLAWLAIALFLVRRRRV